MSSSALAHVHHLQCSFRHLLSNHQTWSIATALLSRTYHSRSTAKFMSVSERKKIKIRRRALISAVKERRLVDRIAREEFSDALHDILKHRGMHGLINRGDTYVSVRELLNYQHFRMLNFLNLQKVVNEDRWQRFELLYEPLKGGDNDSWWIRAKEKERKDIKIDPILPGINIGIAIYGTTLQNWRSYISQKGISRRNDNQIQISQGVPIQNFFTSDAPLSKHVLIHIDVNQAMDMGIRFYLASKPSPFTMPSNNPPTFSTGVALHSSATDSNSPSSRGWPFLPRKNKLTWILTPGNEFGFLPPECFSRVEVVRVKRRVLWTSDEGVVEQEPSAESEEEATLDSDMESTEDVMNYMAVDTRSGRGYEKEHAEVTEKHLDQFFIDVPIDRQARVVHSDLKKEALAVLSQPSQVLHRAKKPKEGQKCQAVVDN